MRKKEVIVVGGGLAGLAAALRLAEHGCMVKLISLTHVKRSHSVCAQGGINAAVNTKDEGDSPLIHAYDTIKGGDFLAEQPPVLEMCLAAPKIIEMMTRFGCTFNRTPEGNLDFRRFGGTLYHRTAFCGASTGQQLLYSLDEQVRRFEANGTIEKFEHHEFLHLIQDDNGHARGIIMLDLFTLRLDILKGDSVVIASGGPGMIFKRSTNSTFCTGAANGRLYLQGMDYANGEFIQIHPSAIPGQDKLRLMSESIRAEGGRVWVYGDPTKTINTPDGRTIQCGERGKPWYFLEELYPAFGNLVPRDIGAREILRVIENGMGIDGEPAVFLDVTHLSAASLKKIDSVLEIYQKFTGDDPRKVPMRIAPAVHYSMGGAWVDWPAADEKNRWERFRQMSNLPGCFVIGEADFQYHGANRLGANSLLSTIFSGLIVGKEVPRYLENLNQSYDEISTRVFTNALKQEETSQKELFNRQGKENVHHLHEQLSEIMIQNVTVKRSNEKLAQTLEQIQKIEERFHNISLDDKSYTLNQTYIFANQFKPMLALAKVITKGALMRDEFRGAHFKEGFYERDDKNWLKSTIASYDPKTKEPKISYKTVDTPYLQPIHRDYTKAQKSKPKLENIPSSIPLPI